MSGTLTGGCLCGAVAYEVEDDFGYALICHCSQCRRATGSAFKPFGGIEGGKVRVTAGEDAHDVHCGTCGSLLWSVVRDGAFAHVTYGTLRDTPSTAPGAHIFVGSKAPWYEIADGLPQFEEFPG